jgi:CubicO group peptidase (beta-lactamase class C family)
MTERFLPLEQTVAAALATGKLAGLAVGIVQDSAIVYTKGFGVRNVETGEPVTAASLFHLASVSKPFSATAIMQLVEQGKVALDDPVVEHLPDFRLADARYAEITIRQLLNHTAGMPDVADYEWETPQTDEGALERYARSLTDQTLSAAPDEKFAYSNMAFEVLGALIARVTGMSFEAYMKTQILTPLGMHRSTFLRSEVPAALATTPHVGEERATVSPVYPYNRRHAPSSTLHSNAREMCRWALTNLNRGDLDGVRILQPASYDLLFKRYRETSEGNAIGLSWFHADYKGHRRISHGGGDTGYASYLALFPDQGAAVAVMANSDWALFDIGPIIDGAADLVLGIGEAA